MRPSFRQTILNAMIICFAVVVGSCLLSKPALAETVKNIKKRGVFEICVSPRAMPLSGLKPKLEKKQPGIQIDFGNALAKAMKVDLKVTWISYRYHAKYTKCDAYLGVARLPNEPLNEYMKKTEPFFLVKMIFATKKDLQLHSKTDFKGLKLAVTNGAVVHDVLRESGAQIFVSMEDDWDKLEALERGDVDVVLVTNLTLGWYKKNHAAFKPFITSTSIVTPVSQYDYVIGLRRSDMMSVGDFNLLITAMIKDGSLATIFNQYGVEYEVNKTDDDYLR